MTMTMTMLKLIGPFELLGLALGMAASCTPTRANQGHCEVQDGDAFCAEKYGDGSRQFCARGIPGCELEQVDGCVAARPVEDACYSPCGGRKSVEEDAECEGVAEASSSSVSGAETETTSEPTGGPTTAGSMSASGTEGSSSTTSSGCMESSECGDPAAPICVEMACVPCTSDDECLAKSPGAPACNEDGQCVTCTPTNASACEGVTPVCNAVNECEGCDFHEQCVGTACDIATGACFADDCVVEVDGDGGADYMNIQAAIVDGCVVVVHELDGVGVPYIGALNVDGIKVAILAADGEEPLVQGTGGNPSLDVSNDAVAYVQGLTLSQNTAEGITVDGATLYLDRTSVVGNTGGGMLLQNASTAYLRNCIVGGTSGSPPAISVTGGTATLLDSTIVDMGINARALSCAVGGTVHARNSLFYGEDDVEEVSCVNFDATFTASEQDLPGEGNEAVALQNTSFANFDAADFRLSGPGAALVGDIARWVTGDPLVDIEGDARVGVDGEMEAAGADVP